MCLADGSARDSRKRKAGLKINKTILQTDDKIAREYHTYLNDVAIRFEAATALRGRPLESARVKRIFESAISPF